MPTHSDKLLFMLGLVIVTTSQVVINALGGALHTQSPIDYAHSLLLIGVVLLIPLAVNLRGGLFRWFAGMLLLVGVVCVIGMCVLDFVFWSLGPSEQADELFWHLREVPAIWQVFMVIGPNWVFNTGLVLPSVVYWHTSKVGTVLVVAGSLVVLIGTQWINVAGYLAIVAGYFLNFDRLARQQSD